MEKLEEVLASCYPWLAVLGGVMIIFDKKMVVSCGFCNF